MKLSIDDAREILFEADVLHEISSGSSNRLLLKIKDSWRSNSVVNEYVRDEDLQELARLFWRYGWAGILYFVSEKNNGIESDLKDNNKAIQTVRHLEDLKK